MDIDDIPVGRVLTRRDLLALFGASSLVLLTGCGGGGSASTTGTGSATMTETGSTGTGAGTGTGATGSGGMGTTTVVVTPAETEGPFFVDENLNRSNLVAGTTRASVVNGTPLALTFHAYSVSSGAATALSGAHVDVWHADAAGTYSDEASSQIQGESTKGQTWLRGCQVTDASGAATFATIYPGWYRGRTVHIHFKVRLYSAAGATTYTFNSQLFFEDTLSDAVLSQGVYATRGTRQVRNANDGIFQSGGSQLLLSPTPSGSGYAASFNVGLQIA